LVLFGVGNPIKGDDSVGLYIADGLKKTVGARPSASVAVRSATSYPELALSRLNLQDSRLVVFDAVEMAKPPGSIVFAGIDETKYGFFATHNLPLRLHPAIKGNSKNVFILGVQPSELEVGTGLSGPVRSAADTVIRDVASLLKGSRTGN
jgi:hydrogenase 3 maturation protease